jgi:hypothetical protein
MTAARIVAIGRPVVVARAVRAALVHTAVPAARAAAGATPPMAAVAVAVGAAALVHTAVPAARAAPGATPPMAAVAARAVAVALVLMAVAAAEVARAAALIEVHFERV